MLRLIIAAVVAMLFAAPAIAQDNFAFRDGLGGLKTRASKNFGANVFGDQVVPSDQYGSPYNATNPLPVNGQVVGTSTANNSGTVTTGGTFQSVIAASTSRKACLIQNPVTATEPLFVNFVVTAVTPIVGNSFSLAAGQSISCVVGTMVISNEVRVTATTTGHAFTAMQQ